MNCDTCIICLKVVKSEQGCHLPCGFKSRSIHKRCLQKYKIHYLKDISGQKDLKPCNKFRCPHCNIFSKFSAVECLQKEIKYYRKKKCELKKREFVFNVEKLLAQWLDETDTEYWVKDSGFMKTENIFRNYKMDCKLMKDVVYCVVNRLHRQVKPVSGVRVWNNFGEDESCKHIFCRCNPHSIPGKFVEYNFKIVRMGIVEDWNAVEVCRDGIVLNCTKRKCSGRHAGDCYL
jgi:hypothetical protein